MQTRSVLAVIALFTFPVVAMGGQRGLSREEARQVPTMIVQQPQESRWTEHDIQLMTPEAQAILRKSKGQQDEEYRKLFLEAYNLDDKKLDEKVAAWAKVVNYVNLVPEKMRLKTVFFYGTLRRPNRPNYHYAIALTQRNRDIDACFATSALDASSDAKELDLSKPDSDDFRDFNKLRSAALSRCALALRAADKPCDASKKIASAISVNETLTPVLHGDKDKATYAASLARLRELQTAIGGECAAMALGAIPDLLQAEAPPGD